MDIILRSKTILIYALFSIFAIIFHLIFIPNVLPWLDEVVLIDTPIHYLKGMGWSTHAWNTNAGREPFSLYMPLYQFLQTAWMKLWGSSIWASRSLNLIITFLIGLSLLSMIKRLGVKLTTSSTFVFAILIWFTACFTYLFRNGRPDLLGALLCVVLFNLIIDFVAENKKRIILMIIISALMCMAGLQACVYTIMVLLLCFVVLKGYRRLIIKASIWTILGSTLGFALTSLFFAVNGYLMAFIENTFAFSKFAKQIAAKLFPLIGPALGLDSDYYMGKLLKPSEVEPVSFISQVIGIFNNFSYDIILVIILLILFLNYKTIRNLSCSKVIFNTLLLSLLIPIIMNLAGRFAVYYYWMTIIPLLLCLVIISCQTELRFRPVLLSLSLIVIFSESILQITHNSYYREMAEFVSKATYFKGKTIASPYMLMYELEKCSNKVYYPGLIKEKDLPSYFDYVLIPEEQNEYNDKLLDLLNKAKNNSSKSVTLISKCNNPTLYVYEIK